MKASDDIPAAPGTTTSGPAAPISIVVCTRDRPASLERCLAALRRGATQPAEIVIVDQGEHAPVSAVIDAVPHDSPPIHYLRQPPLGLGAAQNAGVRAAVSDWIAVTDDDCLPDGQWLSVIAGLAASGRYDMVTGRVLPAPAEGDRTLPVATRSNTAAREWIGRAPPWHVGSGNNFAVLRAAYLAIGGCDERLGPGSPAQGGVDMDLFYRLLRAGARVRFEPASLVLHERQSKHERLVRRPMYGFGMGACFGLWLRQRDVHAVPLAARWFVLRVAQVVRPRDVSRAAALREEATMLGSTVRGILHGLRAPGVREPENVVDV
ncbi:MAG TPA: glycosyltransferase family 2 protein [Longimicrobiales bacterium]|nr:glycosyltransferase family 2 protein [Longimicrobiales bacterium]